MNLSKRLLLFTAGVLLLTGIYLFISLIAYLAGHTFFMASLGAVLFQPFSYTAFFLPFYCFCIAYIAAVPGFCKRALILVTYAVLPWITLALFFQVFYGPVDSPAAAAIIDYIGSQGGSIVLFLLLVAEIIAGYLLFLRLTYLYAQTDVQAENPNQQNQQKQPEHKVADRIMDEDNVVQDFSYHDTAYHDTAYQNDHKGTAVETDPNENPFPAITTIPRFSHSLKDDPYYQDVPQYEDDEIQETDEDIQELQALQDDEDEIDDDETPRAEIDEETKEQGLVEKFQAEEYVFSEGPEYSDNLEYSEKLEEPEKLEYSEESPQFEIERAYESVIEEQIDKRAENGPRCSKHGWEYKNPGHDLLNQYIDNNYQEIDDNTRRAAEVLKETLEEFKITADVTGIKKGPVVTMFEILPAPGVKLSKIVNLADNIALRLAASRVRIVAPIPGKHAVGIEVPNPKRAIVSFREMMECESFQDEEMEIPIILGKDITGDAQIVDLVQMPHLLIAGATGSGKSVCVNSIICSLLYKRSPDEVRLLLIDPKIVELKLYNDIPHLLTPVITEPKRAFQALQYCVYEMERRYALLDSLGVRDVRSFNAKIKKRQLATQPLPYIVIIVDEFADLMATTGKELESTLARLAAMSRAVGIHLVMATQRPSIDVITGLIKANIPARIAFMVAGKFDSRIIIDAVGAEKLLGKGDMLFTSAADPHPIRIQGAFLSEDEVERIAEYVKSLGEPDYLDDEIFIDDDENDDYHENIGNDDPLMDKAVEIIAFAGKASASYLQRRLKIGYNRAARLVEQMEYQGIVGPQNGSKPREVLHLPSRNATRAENSGAANTVSETVSETVSTTDFDDDYPYREGDDNAGY